MKMYAIARPWLPCDSRTRVSRAGVGAYPTTRTEFSEELRPYVSICRRTQITKYTRLNAIGSLPNPHRAQARTRLILGPIRFLRNEPLPPDERTLMSGRLLPSPMRTRATFHLTSRLVQTNSNH